MTSIDALLLAVEIERRRRQNKHRSPLARYCPHVPTERQAAFLALDCPEAFYGGAAGGGKSDALLMAALAYVDVPGYAALLLRRTFSDLALPGALMDRAHTWLATSDARWNERDKTWTFPSGATTTFGYLDNERAKYRYQGSEFHFIGFDELTQFTESQYLYLFSRLRKSAHLDVPLRMRSASNPGGIGHAWVRGRFLIDGPSASRPFIPATRRDNPHLDQESYEQNLSLLDSVTRRQLDDGDWFVTPDGLVYGEFGEGNLTNEEPDPALPIELAADDGYIDPRAILFIQRSGTRILVFDELYHSRHLAEVCVREVVEKCGERFGWGDDARTRPARLPELVVGPPEAKELQQRFRLANIPYRSEPHKIVEGIKVLRRLICDGAQVRSLQVHPRCTNLLKELTEGYRYPDSGTRTSDETPLDEANHATDALRYWAYVRARR